MTTPSQRTRAVLQARELLVELQHADGVPAGFREDARKLLRNYPTSSDLLLMHQALPLQFASPSSEQAK